MDTVATLRRAPPEVWQYQLGTYLALEWVLERKPHGPTIRARREARFPPEELMPHWRGATAYPKVVYNKSGGSYAHVERQRCLDP